MKVSIEDIRDWLGAHMPSLSKQTAHLRDRALHAKLCEHVGMDYEYGELVNLNVLHRKLKQAHYGG
jgi:hypothetical protein